MDLDELLDEVNVKQPNSATPIKEKSEGRQKDIDAQMVDNEWGDTTLPKKAEVQRPERPKVQMQFEQLAPQDEWGNLQPQKMAFDKENSNHSSKEEEKAGSFDWN
jgi:hypothetical protein